MKHSFSYVPDVRANFSNGTQEFHSRRAAEAYSTILALQLKLEAGSRELAQLCKAYEPSVAENHSIEHQVQGAISKRERRRTMFPTGLFADPAWDILLELYRAELCQYRVSVSNLCIASRAPATTALRWINALESQGMVARGADPFDGRRYYVVLTETGSKAMRDYFSGRIESSDGVR